MSPLLTTTSTVICPHAGQAILTTSDTQAFVDGAPVLLITDLHPIAGCTFAPGGVPALLQTSVGLCLNAFQAPQGPAIVVQTQTKAMGV